MTKPLNQEEKELRGVVCTGMTLRDHFAGLAMQGMVSAEFAEIYDLESWANSAYEMADAMLKARDKTL